MKKLKSIPEAVVMLRIPILVFSLILAVLSVPGLFKLDITVTMENFFLADDPVIKNQQRFRELFNDNDFVGVLVETDDVFSRRSLELLKKTGDRLMNDLPLARSVTSLAHGGIAGMNLEFIDGKLVTSDDGLAAFRERCIRDGSLNGTLFTADLKQAWVQIKLKPYPAESEWKEKLKPVFAVGKAAYDTVGSIDPGEGRLIATGLPVYVYRKEHEMMQDFTKVLGVGIAVALVLTVLLFQNLPGVVGTFMVIGLSLVSVLGIQGWLGISIDSAFIAVPILLSTGVAIGYTVHLNNFFRNHFHGGDDRTRAIANSIEKTARPVFFTALTTIAALLSFLTVEIKPIQWVGVTSALSIMLVYLLSMTLFPAILSFGKERSSRSGEKAGRRRFIDMMLSRFSRWVTGHGVIIVLVFLVAAGISIWGMTKLTVDFNAEKMMGTRLPHMKDQARISASPIAAAEMIDLVIALPDGSLTEPAVLKRIDALEKEIGSLPLVQKTVSIVKLVKNANQALHGYQPGSDVIPETGAELALLLEVIKREAPENYASWAGGGGRAARIFIQLTEFSSLEIGENVKKINLAVNRLFPGKIDSFFSGTTYQMAVMNQYITQGLIQSIMTSFGIITIIMIAVFRSFSLGLIAMIPNIFPVFVAGGIMGFLDIPLEFVTMTVAPMILGLAVDDTIHVMTHLNDQFREGRNFIDGLTITLTEIGPAITETSIILCLTFAVFGISQVNSINTMGLVTFFGMLAAYLADIFVTPLLLKFMGHAKAPSKNVN